MKILIIGFAKIKYMPYLNFYLEGLKDDGVDLSVAYWNRDCKDEDLSAYPSVTFHAFNKKQKDEVSKFSKIFNFIRFRRFVKKLIKTGEYDKIVVMHSLPAVLITKTLTKKYDGKFILDYRDYTYEGFAPFRKRLHALIKSSFVTFTSSDAYRKFFPIDCQDKVITSHNFLTDSLSHRDEKIKFGTKSNKIRIVFWGIIRHEEVNKKIIDKLKGDERFELSYHGRIEKTAENLNVYAKETGAENVSFTGEYSPCDRYEFARDTDLIHNVYCDENMMMAMANKFYDGLIFYIPQICMQGSQMGALAKKYGVGIEVDPNSSKFADEIYNYIQNLDYEKFMHNCDVALEKIEKEYLSGQTAMGRFVKD